MKFSKEAMRERLAAIEPQIEKIRAKSGPMREERDRFVNEARAEEAKRNAAIKKAEDGLGDLEQERANILRALGSRH